MARTRSGVGEVSALNEAIGGTALRRSAVRGAGPQRQLLYQPILNLGSMEVVAAEALSRFGDSEAEPWSVDSEIRALEQSGAIVEHGRWLQSCCAYDWWKVAPWGWRLHVNVSPVELSRRGYAEELLRWFPRGGISLELTETSPMPLEATCLRNLAQLEEHGVPLILDDLGDGYNSVQRMLALGCSQVKLSRRWTAGLGVEPQAERALSCMLDRIAGAGRSVTLEGVETATQLDWARDLGCERVQGYGIARPMSIMDLRRWRAAAP